MSAALVSTPVSCARVLIVSKDPELRQRVRSQLQNSATTILEAQGGAEALERLEQEACDLLVLDTVLPDVHPAEVAALARRQHPGLQIATLQELQNKSNRHSMAAAEASPITDPAAEAASADFPQPAAVAAEGDENRVEPLPGMIGNCAAMQEIYRLARLVAPRDTTVLITGETGTGKELVARAIHQLSSRSAGPFVVVNCAAIPETLLEAELFGHVRGAFTGAVQSRLGRIHAAHGGTLFLDEAGELPLAMQAKLLRFLQCGEVQRLGSPDVFRVDVRVILPPTPTWPNWWPAGSSAPTSTGAWRFSRCRCHRCAIAARISSRWRKPSSNASRARPGCRPNGSVQERGRCCNAIAGPATFANYSMPSNAPSSSPRTAGKLPPTCSSCTAMP